MPELPYEKAFYPAHPQPIQPQAGHLYDVAVVGAGLAGCELAWRLARAGRDVLLVSQALDNLGNVFASSVAGLPFPEESLFAKIRREHGADDLWTFHRLLKAELEATKGIHLLQSCISGLDESDTKVTLTSWEGPALHAKKVVLAVGSFLKGRLMVGDTMEEAGRWNEVAYDFLAEDLGRSGVFLVGAEEECKSEPAYSVRFLVPAPQELEGFRLSRFEHVWMVGRCLAGEHRYDSILNDAATLATELLDNAMWDTGASL